MKIPALQKPPGWHLICATIVWLWATSCAAPGHAVALCSGVLQLPTPTSCGLPSPPGQKYEAAPQGVGVLELLGQKCPAGQGPARSTQ